MQSHYGANWHNFTTAPQGGFKIKEIKRIAFIIINRTNLDFIPGLTSTVLSELATTLTKTSPASGWFWRRRNLFTLSSKWFPKRVVCSPAGEGKGRGEHGHGNVNIAAGTVQLRLLLCLQLFQLPPLDGRRGFFPPFCFTSIWKLDGFIYTVKIKRSKPVRAFPPEQTPPCFPHPSVAAEPTGVAQLPPKWTNKGSFTLHFSISGWFYEPYKCFLLPAPLWLVDRDYITLQIWLHATPFQAKQSKSTEMKSLLTSMEISLLLLFFSRELLDCSCSNLHIKVK